MSFDLTGHSYPHMRQGGPEISYDGSSADVPVVSAVCLGCMSGQCLSHSIADDHLRNAFFLPIDCQGNPVYSYSYPENQLVNQLQNTQVDFDPSFGGASLVYGDDLLTGGGFYGYDGYDKHQLSVDIQAANIANMNHFPSSATTDTSSPWSSTSDASLTCMTPPPAGGTASSAPNEKVMTNTVGTDIMRAASSKRRKKDAKFPCPYPETGCCAMFTSSHNAGYHGNSHTGSRPYKCRKCLYAAASPATVKRHEKKCDGKNA
ncbi:hypothetical protein AX15_001892 [Amanita polypyramis BW_CC]|nr:hypothetical protein AX15_001892 [Amanita polypyramis BW_CC]